MKRAKRIVNAATLLGGWMLFGMGMLPSVGAVEALPVGIDWPAFMRQHDMTFDKLPRNWKEAPHFGNAMVGSMLYAEGGKIRLQLFRADVQDHRDDTYGWTGYSRAHLMIGDFYLETVGKLTGGNWRKDLWNAELTGAITTDKGEIRIRHYTHAEDMAIVTELTPSAGEQGCRWKWHPSPSESTRNGDYPKTKEEIPAFAKKYGDHYAKTLKVYQPNPPGRLEKQGDTSVWGQDFLVGGQYATAWREQVENGKRVQVVSIAHSYPASTAARTAVADVDRFVKLDDIVRTKSHRDWWHRYYQQSYVSIPDQSLQSLYWQTIYRFGCTSRADRFYVDCPGIWFQGGRWSYTTTDWNIQCAHWPVYAANRLGQGEELLNRFHQGREELIKAVRPVEWQQDSAYLPIAVAADMIGNREADKRYVNLIGNLPWALHNCWWQYRYSMDDDMLREKLYPLLRRSINMYLHMVEEGADGKLHLPKTYSPELGSFADCNFDLALFKWGCHVLLHASKRLGIKDPLIPRWKEVTNRLVDFSVNEHGFMVGDKANYPPGYRHLGNLLMIYPLYLVNIDQEGARELIEESYNRVNVPGKMKMPAMIQSHAAPIAAAMGRGDDALAGLKALQGNLFPNGMWFDKPCLESSLSMANIVQNMLIQSWSDPAKEESGPIRIFPAVPAEWKDVEFRDLRAEGAFLVSASRRNGVTEWVRIKSLAGESCLVLTDIKGEVRAKGGRSFKLEKAAPGTYRIDLKKGEEVLLCCVSAKDP